MIKLVSHLGGTEPGLQVMAARRLMNLFFAASMLVLFFILIEVYRDSFLAATASILAMSGVLPLYYADMIFVDIPGLFFFLLALYSIIRHEKSGNHFFLFYVIAIASLFAWQTFPLVLFWCCLQLIPHTGFRSASVAIKALGISFFFSGGLLFFILLNESRITGSSLLSSSSFESIRWRAGAGGDYSQYAGMLQWTSYTLSQMMRIVQISVPSWIVPAHFRSLDALPQRAPGWLPYLFFVLLPMTGVVLISLFTDRRKFAVLIGGSGLLWTIVMRHFVAFHDFQALFLIGIPLIVYAEAVFFLQKNLRAWKSLPPLLSFLALALFLAGLRPVIKEKRRIAALTAPIANDMYNIRKVIGPGQSVFIDKRSEEVAGVDHALDFALSGTCISTSGASASFVVSPEPPGPAENLTPHNRLLFLRRGPAGSVCGPDL